MHHEQAFFDKYSTDGGLTCHGTGAAIPCFFIVAAGVSFGLLVFTLCLCAGRLLFLYALDGVGDVVDCTRMLHSVDCTNEAHVILSSQPSRLS